MEKVKEFFKDLWSKIKSTKLNMSIFIAGVVAFILMMTIVIILVSRGGVDTTLVVDNPSKQVVKEDTSETTSEEETTLPEFMTKVDESETGNLVYSASLLKITASIVGQPWVKDGVYYIEYDIDIENVSDKDIDSWATVFHFKSQYSVMSSWSVQVVEDDNLSDGENTLTIMPFNDNKLIKSGEKVSAGFIVCSKQQYVYFKSYTAFVGNKYENLTLNAGVKVTTTLKNEDDTSKKNDETTTPKETKKEIESDTSKVNPNVSSETTPNPSETTPDPSETPDPMTTPEQSESPEPTTTPESSEEKTTPIS